MNLMGVLEGTGHVEINGVVLNRSNMKEIRRGMGMVFQNPDDQLFCPTVMDDVSFGPANLGWSSEEVITASQKALLLVGLEGYGARTSYHLSFGEKKRAAIATILSMNPNILLLDEPTSGLGPTEHLKICQHPLYLESPGEDVVDRNARYLPCPGSCRPGACFQRRETAYCRWRI